MAFGEVKVNKTSAVKHLKMTNVTGAVASMMSVVPSAAEFVVTNDECIGATLTHNQSCTVDIAFSPTVIGKVSGKLMVTTDSTKTQTMELSGIGVP
jgi:hypothetical protein